MVVTKTHIGVGFAIFFLVGITLLVVYWYQRKRNKTVGDIKQALDINTKPVNSGSVISLPGTPYIYGTQRVYKDANGIWRITDGVCEINVSGIVDWDKIAGMPQLEKDTLFNDLGLCKMSRLPLIQP